jgi:hypothetical protein
MGSVSNPSMRGQARNRNRTISSRVQDIPDFETIFLFKRLHSIFQSSSSCSGFIAETVGDVFKFNHCAPPRHRLGGLVIATISLPGLQPTPLFWRLALRRYIAHFRPGYHSLRGGTACKLARNHTAEASGASHDMSWKGFSRTVVRVCDQGGIAWENC